MSTFTQVEDIGYERAANPNSSYQRKLESTKFVNILREDGFQLSLV